MLVLTLLRLILTPLFWMLRILFAPIWKICAKYLPTRTHKVVTFICLALVPVTYAYDCLHEYLCLQTEFNQWQCRLQKIDLAPDLYEYYQFMYKCPDWIIAKGLASDRHDLWVNIANELESMRGNNAATPEQAYWYSRYSCCPNAEGYASLLREYPEAQNSQLRLRLLLPGIPQFPPMSDSRLLWYWIAIVAGVTTQNDIIFIMEHCPAETLKMLPYPTLPEPVSAMEGMNYLEYWVSQAAQAETPRDVIRVFRELTYYFIPYVEFPGGLSIPASAICSDELYFALLERLVECKDYDEVAAILKEVMEEEKAKNTVLRRIGKYASKQWFWLTSTF